MRPAMASTLSTHAVPLSFSSREVESAHDIDHASAALLWVDRSFAVTTAHMVREFQRRLREDPSGSAWLGGLELWGPGTGDAAERLLCISDEADVATILVRPDELLELGGQAAFHSPLQWPPGPVRPGDQIVACGYPQDQWPACVESTFVVDDVDETGFCAHLQHADMPGRLAGMCGAPCFRRGVTDEFVGVVLESMFHNSELRALHAAHVDHCGSISPTSRRTK